MALESGVKEYIYFTVPAVIQFPVDLRGNLHATCSQCWFYGSNSNICNLTKEHCYEPTKFVDGHCPALPQIQEDNHKGGD